METTIEYIMGGAWVEQLKLPNLEVLQFNNLGRVHYGGSQLSFATIRQRFSGCATATGANMIIYLAGTHPQLASLFPYSQRTYDTVLLFMEDMWSHVTPGLRGVDTAERFVAGMVNYSSKLGKPLLPTVLQVPSSKPQRPSRQELTSYLVSQLSVSSPVAFLNLNRGNLRNLESWHWVLLVGIDDSNGNLLALIYDQGSAKTIDLGLWLETTTKGGEFVSFEAPKRFVSPTLKKKEGLCPVLERCV